jgi:hypothetical protein
VHLAAPTSNPLYTGVPCCLAMELRLPPEAPATVTCSGCGQTIYEDEAQASRWGY